MTAARPPGPTQEPASGSHAPVFIAYAAADAPAARALKSALAERGIAAFVDIDLPVGEPWDVAIPRAQARARLTAVLLSDHWPHIDDGPDVGRGLTWYAPEEVALAIAFARKHADRHRVVPVALPGERGPVGWYGLGRLTAIEHRDWPETARLIERALQRTADAEPLRAAPLSIGHPAAEPCLTWLHLADLCVDADGIPPGGRLDDLRRHVLDEQRDRAEHSPTGTWPDLICVTGALTLDGSPEARARALRWLRTLAGDFEPALSADRIVIAPGPSDLESCDPRISPEEAFAAQSAGFGGLRRERGFAHRDVRVGRMPLRIVALDPCTVAPDAVAWATCMGPLPDAVPLTLVLADASPGAAREGDGVRDDLARRPHVWLSSGSPGVTVDDAVVAVSVGRRGASDTYACGRLSSHGLDVDVMTYQPRAGTYRGQASSVAPHRWPGILRGLLATHAVTGTPAPAPSRLIRAADAFELLRFDRTKQWHALQDALAGRRHLVTTVVGHDSQSVSIFLERVQTLAGAEREPLRSVHVPHHAQGTAARPASAAQWQARVLTELGIRDVRTLEQALSRIARRQGLLLLLGPLRLEAIYGASGASAPAVDLTGVRDFIQTLPELAGLCAPHHLRVVIGVEHGESSAAPVASGAVARLVGRLLRRPPPEPPETVADRWLADFGAWTAGLGRGAVPMHVLPLDPLALPDFDEIETLLAPFDPPDALIEQARLEYARLGAASLATVVTRLNAILESHGRTA